MDLRKTMASSILVVGGTTMIPGFIPRLHTELLRAIQPPPFVPRHPIRPDRPPPPQYDRYASLRPLTPYFAIVNNPSPGEPHSDRAKNNAGKAPAFTPATMAWVGASLAGYVVRQIPTDFSLIILLASSKLVVSKSVERNGTKQRQQEKTAWRTHRVRFL